MPRELKGLIESLAANNHDLWSVERLREGWRYGPERDDAKKTNPCLVPYEDLPESEKEYDRIMAVGVLKVVLSRGYRIEKSG